MKVLPSYKKLKKTDKKKSKLLSFREWCMRQRQALKVSKKRLKKPKIVEWGGKLWTDRDWR